MTASFATFTFYHAEGTKFWFCIFKSAGKKPLSWGIGHPGSGLRCAAGYPDVKKTSMAARFATNSANCNILMAKNHVFPF